MRDDLLRYDERHRGEVPFFKDGNDIQDDDQSGLQGPTVLPQIFALPEGDRDARFRLVIDNVAKWLLEDILSAVADGLKRRELHPSPNDVRQDEQEPLLFLGDSLEPVPPPSRDPLSAGA
ncbi:hypothetical protein DHEL01_v203062 [Diaporthe helianthi]|uniref:Uncharacterized protein n=1 Tax=Diaporthe helianthi TaxID=158607 RepID=A0A2P5I7P6_DIAHE|nr:hypothetical protein DHEL01_v203062 [Diaporthe helianthi]